MLTLANRPQYYGYWANVGRWFSRCDGVKLIIQEGEVHEEEMAMEISFR